MKINEFIRHKSLGLRFIDLNETSQNYVKD